MRIRPLATWMFLLSLCSMPVSAQIYDVYERPRNAIALPVNEPVAVDIYLPQDELYAVDKVSSTMAAGPLAGGIVQALDNRRNARQDELVRTLQADMPVVDHDALLRQAFAKHIGPAQLANIKRVTVHRGTPADTAKAAPGDPNEQTLALVVRYYLGPMLCDLRVSMSARLGPRSIVTAPPRGKGPAFSQILAWDVPAGCKIIAHEDKLTRHWTDMGAVAISNHVVAGIDGVMAMLPHALATRPRFNRVPGKQIPWNEGMYSNSMGTVETRMDGRVLVRLRNGLLVSLPDGDERVRDLASK